MFVLSTHFFYVCDMCLCVNVAAKRNSICQCFTPIFFLPTGMERLHKNSGTRQRLISRTGELSSVAALGVFPYIRMNSK
jgi:hypothetical protein